MPDLDDRKGLCPKCDGEGRTVTKATCWPWSVGFTCVHCRGSGVTEYSDPVLRDRLRAMSAADIVDWFKRLAAKIEAGAHD